MSIIKFIQFHMLAIKSNLTQSDWVTGLLNGWVSLRT